jgi:hypothetical protein
MRVLKELTKKSKRHEAILVVLFVIYIISNFSTPTTIAPYIDNIYGHIVVIILAIYLFVHNNAIVGVLSILAAYELIRRSSNTTGSYGLKQFLPSEQKKNQQYSAFNKFPLTLEEEVVRNMVPLVGGSPMTNPKYKPILEPDYGASKL